MSDTLPSAQDCCLTCNEAIVTSIPGAKGDPCDPCTDGAAGDNAWSLIDATAPVLIPVFGASATIALQVPPGNHWIALNQIIYLAGYGYYQATAVNVDGIHATIKNLGDGAGAYPANVNGNGILTFASGTKVSPGGVQGATGAAPANVMLKTDNLSGLANVATSRTNLGLGTMATQNANAVAITGGAVSGITDLPVADGGTGASTAAGARTNLAAAATGLATASGLTVSATDRVLGRSTAGAGPVEEISCTAVGRTLIAASTAQAQRTALGKVGMRHGLLGSLTAVDLNVATSDNAVTMECLRYRVDKVTVEAATVNLTAATAGVFTGAGGGGTTLAADQVLSALTASTKFVDITLQAVCGTDVRTEGTLYFRVGTPQGVAATANVWIWGWRYD